MITVLDIGNTHTRRAVWNGARFEASACLDTASLGPADLPGDMPVAAACVVPAVREALAGCGVLFIDARHCGSRVDFSRADTATLGADRVANAIALAALFPLPGIVVDCGTAITLEAVDAAGVFRGGAILPGRALMRRSLARGTAQLPAVPLSEEVPALPGLDTGAAIRFGIDAGLPGLIGQLVRTTAAALDATGPVSMICTGGDAPFFLRALPELRSGGDDFTLQGIRLAAMELLP